MCSERTTSLWYVNKSFSETSGGMILNIDPVDSWADWNMPMKKIE